MNKESDSGSPVRNGAKPEGTQSKTTNDEKIDPWGPVDEEGQTGETRERTRKSVVPGPLKKKKEKKRRTVIRRRENKQGTDLSQSHREHDSSAQIPHR